MQRAVMSVQTKLSKTKNHKSDHLSGLVSCTGEKKEKTTYFNQPQPKEVLPSDFYLCTKLISHDLNSNSKCKETELR